MVARAKRRLSVCAWLLAGLAAGCARGPERTNVLFVVVDTLRADRLGCYGWHEPTSPHVDALAAEGVLFERALAQVPQTLPSVCSILTGRVPRSHGVRVNGMFALPPEATTLPEVLHDAGYRTAGIVAGFPLDARFGIDQGFELYDDRMRAPRPMGGLAEREEGGYRWAGHETEAFESTADQVTEDALAWLTAEQEPFFLFLHYFDPHHDYAPPERWRVRFEHPYAGEVAFVDEQLGRVLARLAELGLDQRTLVVFTADHGECLGEHGRHLHQSVLFDAALHVPLVLRLPGRLAAGLRVPAAVRSIDVLPTVLELLGLPPPAGAQGRSLVAALGGRSSEEPPVYFESEFGRLEGKTGVSRAGLEDGRWKVVRNRRLDPASGEPEELFELYDLEADPDELLNLAPTDGTRLRAMLDELEAFEASHPLGHARVETPSERTLEKLKALGYL